MSSVPPGECTVLEGVLERSMSVPKERVPDFGQLDDVVEFPGLPSDDFDASNQTNIHDRITTVPILASRSAGSLFIVLPN
jgi:hypothetical protein